MLLDYAAVKEAAGDWERFTSADGILLPSPPRPMAPPIEFDPPVHGQWRAVFRKLLAPPARKALEEQVATQAEELIDSFCGTGQADLVTEYAEPIPIRAIAALIGLEAELAPTMRRLGLAVSDSTGTPAYGDAIAAFTAFALDQVEARRAAPRDDFLTELGKLELDGRPLTDDEIIGTLVSLMIAGHHSTVSALASLLMHVMGTPGLKKAVAADTKVLDRAIEETVRLNTPLHQFRRVVTEDIRYSGLTIRSGSSVLVNYAAANRDPAHFEHPEAFDLERSSSMHLGFGHGVHYCVGAPLARAELRIATTAVIDRLPDISVEGEPVHRFHGQLSMLEHLPVTFAPAPPRRQVGT
ncbi:cytochrome P450 [Streptomyces sp. NPDC005728]|uniref:cytochrome P450 n=1 Tax=Streptomyces sp. NPDC005728 TaxID=3157054 RepID=UPI0034038A05